MTKEVDFLSLSKTSNNKITTSPNPTSIKKEGLSLFDSLLANKIENKADIKTISNESLSKENDSLKNQIDDASSLETKNTKTEEHSKKIENTKTEEHSKKIEYKNTETSEIKDIKSEVKITQSSTSLLDKMIEQVKVEIVNKESLDNSLIKENITKNINSEITSITKESLVQTKLEIKDTNVSLVKEKIQTTLNIEDKFTKEVKTENRTVVNEKITPITTQNQINKIISKEFTKLDSSAIVKEEQKVNIDKNTLLKENTQLKDNIQELKTPRSLMDRLLDNASKTINITDNQEKVTPSLQNTSNTKANDFVTNIFLGSQKNSIYTQMIANKTEGVKVVKEGTKVEDIKKGAELLNLGLKDTSIETKVNTNQLTNQVNNPSPNNKENDLNRLAFNRNINNNENLENKQNTKILNNQKINPIDTASSTASATAMISSTSSVIEEAVTLNVNPSLVLSIQNRIIGAQQHMSSMMSDIARNMYENYKPPVTAFRINLFPAQLGQIAILMKNDKENSISISLNMSNSNTLDAFVENQNTLRDALNRNFNNNQTTFNLDFNMGNESSGNKSFNEQENNKNNETPSSNEIIEAINQNQDVGEDLNYL